MRRLSLLAPAVLLACSSPPPPPPPPAPPASEPITFKSTPPGAHVTLDGQALPDAAPFSKELAPGSGHHLARFTLDGYEPVDVDFLVPLAPYTAEVTLKPAPKIQVTTTPSGASVELDGRLVLPTTPGPVAIPSGEHELVVKLAGYVPVRRHLKSGEHPAISAQLQRSAVISVHADRPGAHIVVDGADTGLLTPSDEVPVAAGRPHRISARYEKLRSPDHVLKALRPGQTATVSLELVDMDRRTLEARRRAVKAELAQLEAQRSKLDRRTSGFFVKNARAEQREVHQLQDVEAKIDDLSNELADLNDQLDGP